MDGTETGLLSLIRMFCVVQIVKGWCYGEIHPILISVPAWLMSAAWLFIHALFSLLCLDDGPHWGYPDSPCVTLRLENWLMRIWKSQELGWTAFASLWKAHSNGSSHLVWNQYLVLPLPPFDFGSRAPESAGISGDEGVKHHSRCWNSQKHVKCQPTAPRMVGRGTIAEPGFKSLELRATFSVEHWKHGKRRVTMKIVVALDWCILALYNRGDGVA